MKALRPFLQYLSLYLSIALVGESIVHLPINPVRFSIIGCIGLALFIVSSYFEALRKKESGELNMTTARYLGLSFILSLGLGMLSGSIQHYLDSPFYASALIPIGFLMAFISYSLREASLNLKGSAPFLVALIVGTSAAGLALYKIADSIEHAGHAHTH
jgi:hypothetical protein